MPAADTSESNRLYLINLRKRLSLRQVDLANALEMSLAAYSALETGASRCKRVHILAAERLSLTQAMLTNDRNVIAPSVAKDIVLARMI